MANTFLNWLTDCAVNLCFSALTLEEPRRDPANARFYCALRLTAGEARQDIGDRSLVADDRLRIGAVPNEPTECQHFEVTINCREVIGFYDISIHEDLHYLKNMFIDALQCHLAVCAQRDLPRMARIDPEFWNVISIREPERPAIQKHGFKKIVTVICYDMVGREGLQANELAGIPRKEHIQSILRFADLIVGEPILVHCWAGVSRSTAVALALIVRQMHSDGYSLDEIRKEAPKLLIAIRPQAAPNPLVLELGLAEFLSPVDTTRLVIDLVNHPVLFANSHKTGDILTS